MVTLVLGVALVATPSAQAETTNVHPVELRSVLNDEVIPYGFTSRPVGEGRDACPIYHLCIWTGTNFTGRGLGITGNVVPGDGFEWLNTVWENNVHSAVNKGTVTLESFNYRPGGGKEYLGGLAPGYDFRCCWPGATKADGILYR
ncbi:peptidase inhibitor family I36 protein [Amycolatopsis anabasis]|uniref:peptidase inhibitor family I36 protein n=1 Tax=Amycolatopsis anabasis TaxID=1840409 RepID=UPI00131BFF41|nr:peptidase inhibitor family I36 protein [Amycolatopsis anabasis]